MGEPLELLVVIRTILMGEPLELVVVIRTMGEPCNHVGKALYVILPKSIGEPI